MTLAFAAAASLLVVTSIVFIAYRRARHRANCLAAELQRVLDINAQQLQSLRKRNELDSVKDEFISTVSHELRTPLTSIRGALGLLSGGMLGEVDPKAQNLLRIASNNTDRLVRLINDILDLERMDSGLAPLQLHRCSMWELAIQAIDSMSAMAQAAGISMEVIPMLDGETVAFDGDSDRILQVLCNLLSNAIKFSPAGATVRIHCSSEASGLLLRVEDEGRGVPMDKLEAIFGRFQQVHTADARQKGGSGLGLAICRSIAVQHGGTIWAERNEDVRPGASGTTLVMRLPRIEPDAEGSQLIPEASALANSCGEDTDVLTSAFA